MTTIPDFLASECERRAALESTFHIIPAPMEQTVSYVGGAAGGPEAILHASQQLEDWDGRSCPLALGIHTRPFVDCRGSAATVLARIKAAAAEVLAAGKIPVVLGGEHTVTVGALQAVAEQCEEPVGLIQIDAHGDLRDHYEGTPYSHACVARRAVDDLGMPLFQFGIRALSRDEFLFRKAHPAIWHLDGAELFAQGIPLAPLPPEFPRTVYLTFDVDGLDPSVIRATGTPVPGGATWHQALLFLERALKGRRVVGFDVVELAPTEDDHGSSFAAALLVYAIMGLIQRG
ncbi:MAG: agmatinase [Desulfobulbaceae bacterium]|jgi:agmatinase|nr:agmatinase [Desulfobulbaceae bacterium]